MCIPGCNLGGILLARGSIKQPRSVTKAMPPYHCPVGILLVQGSIEKRRFFLFCVAESSRSAFLGVLILRTLRCAIWVIV